MLVVASGYARENVLGMRALDLEVHLNSQAVSVPFNSSR